MSKFSEIDADITTLGTYESRYEKRLVPEEVHVLIEVDVIKETSRNLGVYSNFFDAHKARKKEQDSADEVGRYKYLLDTIPVLD